MFVFPVNDIKFLPDVSGDLVTNQDFGCFSRHCRDVSNRDFGIWCWFERRVFQKNMLSTNHNSLFVKLLNNLISLHERSATENASTERCGNISLPEEVNVTPLRNEFCLTNNVQWRFPISLRGN